MVAANAAECIASGDCLVMTKTVYNMAIASYTTAAILTILIILILWRTPAMTFLKAWMTRRPIMYLINRSQQARFTTTKAKYEGILDIYKSGPYIITENSHTIESTTGRPVYVAFGEFAATLPMWWVSVINTIKRKFGKKGENISNVADLGDKIGLEYDASSGSWKKKDAKQANEDIKVPTHKTIKLHDLVNMFPFNITPAMMESRQAHAIAAKQKLWNTLNSQNILMFGILFVMIMIGAVIAYKFMGGGAPEIKVTVDQAGKLLAANMTG